MSHNSHSSLVVKQLHVYMYVCTYNYVDVKFNGPQLISSLAVNSKQAIIIHVYMYYR